jgi:hypothetical protein
MTTLLALLLRLVIFAVLTFGFVVLFEHGPSNYVENIPVEFNAFKSYVSAKLSQESAPAPTPTPTPTPAPTPEPTPEQPAPPPATPAPTPQPASNVGSWQKLQSAPIGNGGDLPIGATEKPAN